jgi:hypothetical protein
MHPADECSPNHVRCLDYVEKWHRDHGADVAMVEDMRLALGLDEVALQSYLRDIKRWRYIRCTVAGGRIVAFSVIEAPWIVDPPDPISPRRVFIVHGRELAPVNVLEQFLDSLGLESVTFQNSLQADITGEAAPLISDILSQALNRCQAVIVVLTQEESASLLPCYRQRGDKELSGKQPRLNVVFEAGMAMGLFPKRTVLVQFGGPVRQFSDIAGRHLVEWSGGKQSRAVLRTRLEAAGCELSPRGDRWETAGGSVDLSHLGCASSRSARPRRSASRARPTPRRTTGPRTKKKIKTRR